MTTEPWDYLDDIAVRVAKGDERAFGPLSTGERLYVALAANRPELAQNDGYTIVEAMNRLGDDWLGALVERWRYRGDPRKYE